MVGFTQSDRTGFNQQNRTVLVSCRTWNNWQRFKESLYEVKSHMVINPFPVYSVYSNQLLSTKH